jgi:hypothetical protein
VVVAVIVVVPDPVAVTSPDAETVATLTAPVCHASPEVTTTPALVAAVSWLVCPTPDRRAFPLTVRMAAVGTGVVVGVVGDPQEETICATTRLMGAHNGQSRGLPVRSRRSSMTVIARPGSIDLTRGNLLTYQ